GVVVHITDGALDLGGGVAEALPFTAGPRGGQSAIAVGLIGARLQVVGLELRGRGAVEQVGDLFDVAGVAGEYEVDVVGHDGAGVGPAAGAFDVVGETVGDKQRLIAGEPHRGTGEGAFRGQALANIVSAVGDGMSRVCFR